jgi:hypothetical protein
MGLPRRSSRPRYFLAPQQYRLIDQVTASVRPQQRDDFRLRISQILRLSTQGAVTDELLKVAIEKSLREVAA